MASAPRRSSTGTSAANILRGSRRAAARLADPFFAESTRTPDVLEEAGLEFLRDYTCDDQPFPIKARSGSPLSISDSLEINDIAAFLAIRVGGAAFGTMIRDQFDVLYREGERNGRVLAICLLTFLIGQPFRAKHLDEALGYVMALDGGWATTAGELSAWCRASCL